MKGLGSIIVFGLLVALAPYMGLPGNVRDMLVVALGALIALIAFVLKQKHTKRVSGTPDIVDHKPYMQNEPPLKQEDDA